MGFYEFSATDIDNREITMDKYRGKVVLVVNTASKCGLTPQFKELEEVYQQYKDSGFEILGFPCNQFMNQELETSEEINNFCQLNYGVTFTMFDRIDVNGENAHPLYKYLRSQSKGVLSDKIKWNFTKFLIDSEGNVVKRYAPTTKPEKIKKDIEKLIK